MQAFGEPFLLSNSANFYQIQNGYDVLGNFDWNPTNTESRANPYFVVFRTTNGSYSFDETIQIKVASTTSINEVELESCKIFPNPAFDEFYIEFDLDKSADILVVVYDLLGKKVTTFSTEKGIGKHLFKSNFNLESGQYIISIQKDNVEFKSEKLLITK